MRIAHERYVVDASVVAKWFLDDEDFVDVAERYLKHMLADEIQMHAPTILAYELGHVLIKAQRPDKRRIPLEKSLEAYRTFCKLPIVFHKLDDNDGLRAFEFASRYQRSFYDATYICLAMSLGCQWLTSERRYARQLPRDFPLDYVLPLEQL